MKGNFYVGKSNLSSLSFVVTCKSTANGMLNSNTEN